MRSHKDDTKIQCAFSAVALSYDMRFQRKQVMIENFKYLGDLAKDFRKCWLHCVWYLLMIE